MEIDILVEALLCAGHHAEGYTDLYYSLLTLWGRIPDLQIREL